MNILFLTSRFPFPPIGADKLRVCKILDFLSKEHSITLFLFIDKKFKDSEVNAYRKYFSRIEIIYLPSYISYLNCIAGLFGKLPLQVYYYYSSRMKRLINKEIKNFDLIFVHLIRMAEYVKDFNNIPKILDLEDAISLNYERSIKYQKGMCYLRNKIEKERVLKYETTIINNFDKSILVSEIDKSYLNKYADTNNVVIIPVGIDLEFFSYSNDNFDSECIVFLGNMRTFPNNDAVVYFYNEIFPLILKDIPNSKFYIVGANPTRMVSSLGKRKNVVVTGQVSDVRPYLRRAVVSVCPMRTGAGIQNKILESMASGTPVITSSMGLEGIQAIPNEEIFVADDKYEFAEKTVNLIKDKELRNKLSLRGRKLVEMKYSNESIMEEFEKIIQELKN
jgi:sugar transferase (PEP-CTERM/EpsH1 system associated)